MRDYRCKCGKNTGFGSMPPAPCTGCDECGTQYEDVALVIRELVQWQPIAPHDWGIEMVDTDEGPKPVTRCNRCGARKPDEEPDE